MVNKKQHKPPWRYNSTSVSVPKAVR